VVVRLPRVTVYLTDKTYREILRLAEEQKCGSGKVTKELIEDVLKARR